MDLKFAWWNCRLSPPSTGAKKSEPNLGFFLSLVVLLTEKQVDVLGLCEVDDSTVEAIEQLLKNLELADFKVVNLYSKKGNAIDDYCLIYNSSKLVCTDDRRSLNGRGAVLDERLKTGFLVKFLLLDGKEIFIILCHWQSRNTYKEGSVYRDSLGRALRESINIIMSSASEALVVVCGDFNDEPFDSSIQKNLGASRDAAFVKRKPKALFNPFWNCLGVTKDFDFHPEAAGTCHYGSDFEFTHWKTFDQIIFSSAFLGSDWSFIAGGAEIVNDIPIQDVELSWSEISDHYPVMSHLRRNSL